MFFALFLIVSVISFVTANYTDVYCKSVETPDYYWREYKGVIPFDAVPGGTDKAGRPVYIGQAMVYSIGNIPASIYHGNLSAVTSSAQTFYIDNNVKILCSGSPDKFKWIATDTDSMHLLTNCEIIPGGLDYQDMVYIGRVNHEGEVRLGKVIKKHRGLLVPDKGKEAIFNKFELLVFDCKPKVP